MTFSVGPVLCNTQNKDITSRDLSLLSQNWSLPFNHEPYFSI